MGVWPGLGQDPHWIPPIGYQVRPKQIGVEPAPIEKAWVSVLTQTLEKYEGIEFYDLKFNGKTQNLDKYYGTMSYFTINLITNICSYLFYVVFKFNIFY